MDFLVEVFWALLMVGVPIAAFTTALVWWALQREYLQESSDAKALEREIKALSRNTKKARKEDGAEPHPLQKKWAKFGGGFYGIVAFLTYIVIELTEITTMIANLGGFFAFIKRLDIGFVISMIVEAFTNFIAAMVWPMYWLQRIETNQVWVWFLAAYGGYWVGLKLAQYFIQRRSAEGS